MYRIGADGQRLPTASTASLPDAVSHTGAQQSMASMESIESMEGGSGGSCRFEAAKVAIQRRYVERAASVSLAGCRRPRRLRRCYKQPGGNHRINNQQNERRATGEMAAGHDDTRRRRLLADVPMGAAFSADSTSSKTSHLVRLMKEKRVGRSPLVI